MSEPGSVGFFGKLPGLGDFVQRRLPPDFVGAWDAGFEAAVNAARATFGAQWHAVWQASPIWRFALAPGVCGAQAWAGVMGPSVDRVGRGFPMVLACVVIGAEALTRVVQAGAGWYSVLERIQREAGRRADASADAFDAAVAAVPDPLAWLSANGTMLSADDRTPTGDAWCVPWRQASDDHQLATLAAACAALPDACLWWTQGAARVPPSVRMTRGLPHPETYAAFLAVAPAYDPDALATGGSSAPPLVESADVFAGLLSDFEPAMSEVTAPRLAGIADQSPAPAPAVREVVSRPGIVCRQDGPATLLAADNGAPDPRRQATVQVTSAWADSSGGMEMEAIRARMLALHPPLYARREDLIDPVPEDGALVVACVVDARADVFRVGSAAAWHWRHGQLVPLFAGSKPTPPDQADTLRPGDLLGAASPTSLSLPGLGAAELPDCEEVNCIVAAGDRLLLLATDKLVALPAETLAASLMGTTGAQAESRIAAAAGLGTDRAEWPLAVIEVGT